MIRAARLFVFCWCLSGWNARGTVITALAFSPDGSALVSSGRLQVDIRSAENGKVTASLPCDFPRVTALAFTPAGQLVVAGGIPGVSGAVTIFDWQHRQTLGRWKVHEDLVTCVAASPDGQWLAWGSADHGATLGALGQDLSKAPKLIKLVGHSAAVLAVAFTPDSQSVISASADRSIKLWTLQGGLVRTLAQHTESVNVLALRPRTGDSPTECASGSEDHTVRVWQPEIGRMVRIVRGHEGPIYALAYSPDGAALYSAGSEGVLRQIDVESDQILSQRNGHQDVIYSLAISPNGQKLASGDWSGKIKLWRLEKNGPVELTAP